MFKNSWPYKSIWLRFLWTAFSFIFFCLDMQHLYTYASRLTHGWRYKESLCFFSLSLSFPLSLSLSHSHAVCMYNVYTYSLTSDATKNLYAFLSLYLSIALSLSLARSLSLTLSLSISPSPSHSLFLTLFLYLSLVIFHQELKFFPSYCVSMEIFVLVYWYIFLFS